MMEDTYYCALVKQVEAHPPLNGVIKSLTEDHKRFLNLVDVKWEQHLSNNGIYRKLRDETRKCFTRQSSGLDFASDNMRPTFPLILLASCRFFKPVESSKNETAVVIQECEPLLKIINTMHSDHRSQDIHLRMDSKFSFINCRMECRFCNEKRTALLKKGCNPKFVPPIGSVLPCPMNTPIYDGQAIQSSFVNEIQRIYSDTFLALLVVEIKSRYTFTDKFSPKGKSHRVGGIVYKMIAFDEGKLYASGMMNEDVRLSLDMGGYCHDDTFAHGVQINGPETTDESVSHGKRQWQQPHASTDSWDDEGHASFSNWGQKRQKLDFAREASNSPSNSVCGAAKPDRRNDYLSEDAVMDMLTENNSSGSNKELYADEDKSLLDDPNVVAGASSNCTDAKRLFLEEGEDEEEEEDICKFNIIEAYPSTCKMKPKVKLVANESYEEFI